MVPPPCSTGARTNNMDDLARDMLGQDTPSRAHRQGKNQRDARVRYRGGYAAEDADITGASTRSWPSA